MFHLALTDHDQRSGQIRGSNDPVSARWRRGVKGCPALTFSSVPRAIQLPFALTAVLRARIGTILPGGLAPRDKSF